MSRGLSARGPYDDALLAEIRRSIRGHSNADAALVRIRGAYLELCRVFLPGLQLDLFRAYHDADEALRQSVIMAMNELPDEAPTPFVLQGLDFSATGKLTNVSNVPLCPVMRLVRLVNSGVVTDPNVELAPHIRLSPISGRRCEEHCARSDPRRPSFPDCRRSALDRLDMRAIGRQRMAGRAAGGRIYEAKVGINGAIDADQLLPFFRPPATAAEDATPYSRGGPYAISAYLRLWKACSPTVLADWWQPMTPESPGRCST